jgi:hypothetical protein
MKFFSAASWLFRVTQRHLEAGRLRSTRESPVVVDILQGYVSVTRQVLMNSLRPFNTGIADLEGQSPFLMFHRATQIERRASARVVLEAAGRPALSG